MQHLHGSVCTYVHVSARAGVHVNVCVCMHACMHACLDVCMDTYTCTYMHRCKTVSRTDLIGAHMRPVIRSGESDHKLALLLAHLEHWDFSLHKQIRRNHSHFIMERSVEADLGCHLCLHTYKPLRPRDHTFQRLILVSWHTIPVERRRAQGHTTVGTEAAQLTNGGRVQEQTQPSKECVTWKTRQV